MARLFDDASSEYLELDSAPVTGTPFTMAGHFYMDADVDSTIMGLADKDTDAEFFKLFMTDTSREVRFRVQITGSGDNVDSITSFSQDTWNSICGVATSPSARAIYLNGGGKNTTIVSKTPSGIDRISIGRIGDTSPVDYMSGRIAECGLWENDLSDEEAAAQGKGFSPLFIQPHNLVAYWPLIRDDDNDLIGGYDLTAFNTPSVADHPPLTFYPQFLG